MDKITDQAALNKKCPGIMHILFMGVMKIMIGKEKNYYQYIISKNEK